MAAATIASVKYHNAGDCQMVTAALTSVADTNTWDTGLCEVDNCIVSVATNSTPQYAGWTQSTVNGVIRITFDMSGTASLVVTAIGR